MRKTIILACIALSACKHEECKNIYHDKLRHQYFQQCIETMAKQPWHNNEDNNGHVVEACDSAARATSTEWHCETVDN